MLNTPKVMLNIFQAMQNKPLVIIPSFIISGHNSILCHNQPTYSYFSRRHSPDTKQKEEEIQEEAAETGAAEARTSGDRDRSRRDADILLPRVSDGLPGEGTARDTPGGAQDREAVHLRNLWGWVSTEN